MPFAPSQALLYVGKEIVYGTPPANPTFAVPLMAPSWTPDQAWLTDTGMKGSLVGNYDQVAGVRHDEFQHKVSIYMDLFPIFALASLGGPDTVTGTATPYGHSIPLLNVASSGSQPASWTIWYFDGGTWREMSGGILSDLALVFTADGAVEGSLTWLTLPEANTTAPASPPAFLTQHMVPGWDVSLTIAAVLSTVFVSGEINIKRNTAPIPVANMQAPYRIWAGKCEVTGKDKFIVESTDQTFVDGLARNQLALVHTFTDPVTGYTVTAQMSAAQFEKPHLDPGKEWLEVETEVSAVANTTDAGGSGFSPILIKASNGHSSAY